MKKFTIYGSDLKITETEIIRETEKCVFKKSTWNENGEQKELKDGYTKYFDTFEEAKQYLIRLLLKRIKNYEDSIIHTNESIEKNKIELEKVNQLKETEPNCFEKTGA